MFLCRDISKTLLEAGKIPGTFLIVQRRGEMSPIFWQGAKFTNKNKYASVARY
jgi:hypothetical protein